MIFRPDISVPIGFAPVTTCGRVVGGADFTIGSVGEVDVRNSRTSTLTPGAADSGWSMIVPPSVVGARGVIPQVVVREAIANGAKGEACLSGIVKIADSSGTAAKGDLLTIDDKTAGRRYYGIALSNSSGGLIDALWDGEDGLGQLVEVNLPGNDAPVAALTATPSSGNKPLSVTLDASGSTDDSAIIKYEFDYGEGMGWVDNGTDADIVHVYARAGTYTAAVRVTDDGTPALQDIATVQIVVSNPDPGVPNSGSSGGDDGGGTSDPGEGGVIVVVPF